MLRPVLPIQTKPFFSAQVGVQGPPKSQNSLVYPHSKASVQLHFGSEQTDFHHEGHYEGDFSIPRAIWKPVRNYLLRLISYWDKALDFVDDKLAKLWRMLAPVSVPILQEALIPLLHQSSAGFPVGLLRASLIRKGSPDAMLSYQALQEKYLSKTTDPTLLLKNLVDSESQAYLASHLMAMETAIKTPGQKLQVDSKPSLRPLRIGINDANAVVARRTTELLYGHHRHSVANGLYNLILASPKVVLHEHYRGCAPMAMVRAWFIEQQHSKAYKGNDALQEFCRTDRLFTPDGEGPLYQRSLNRFRLKNDNLVSVSIHSDDTAYLAAYMYTMRLGLENVRYFEYRLNPLSKNVKNPIRYAKAIQQGLDDARTFLYQSRGQKIDGNLIFSADRQPKAGVVMNAQSGKQLDPRVSLAMQVLDVAIQAKKEGVRVTGFDIQGDEAGYAITDFKPVADALKAYNRNVCQNGHAELRIGATIHAGETPFSGLLSHPKSYLTGQQSVEKAIELFWDPTTPVRIGHGIRAIYDPRLLKTCVEKNIGFEQCPKSNVQTGAVSYYTELPTLTLSRPSPEGHGLLVNISCDNRTTSKTNSCNELVKLTRHLGARHADRKKFQTDGMEMAFIFDPVEKQRLQNEMMATYRQIESHDKHRRIIALEQDEKSFRTLIDGQD